MVGSRRDTSLTSSSGGSRLLLIKQKPKFYQNKVDSCRQYFGSGIKVLAKSRLWTTKYHDLVRRISIIRFRKGHHQHSKSCKSDTCCDWLIIKKRTDGIFEVVIGLWLLKMCVSWVLCREESERKCVKVSHYVSVIVTEWPLYGHPYFKTA